MIPFCDYSSYVTLRRTMETDYLTPYDPRFDYTLLQNQIKSIRRYPSYSKNVLVIELLCEIFEITNINIYINLNMYLYHMFYINHVIFFLNCLNSWQLTWEYKFFFNKTRISLYFWKTTLVWYCLKLCMNENYFEFPPS